MDIKFTVGEFAKLHNMKKQTLIFYDKIDLFKPEIIDEHNGYRYYTPKQLEILDSILILKEIGVPLKEIKQFLEDRDDEKALKLMKQQKEELDKQVEKLSIISERLGEKIKTFEQLKFLGKRVSFKEVNEDYLAIRKVNKPYNLIQTDIALKNLLKDVTDKNYPYNYQLGVMVPINNIQNKLYTSADFVFTPVDKRLKKDDIIIKPKGMYAISYHKGGYDKVGETYEEILKEIEKSNLTPYGHSYEYCILDSLTCRTPKEYITRIEIPIK